MGSLTGIILLLAVILTSLLPPGLAPEGPGVGLGLAVLVLALLEAPAEGTEPVF